MGELNPRSSRGTLDADPTLQRERLVKAIIDNRSEDEDEDEYEMPDKDMEGRMC
jgi:hypothetical protein